MKRINFSSLEANEELVKKLFGYSFYEKSLHNCLHVSEVLEANEELLKYQVGDTVARLIHQRNVEEINALMEKHLRKYPVSYENDANEDIGIIVVRPEAQWFENRITKWLEENNIQIVEYYKSSIDFWLHWNLYFADLKGFEDRCDFPSRILNYNNQELHVMLVRYNPVFDSKIAISKFLNDRKGIAGLYQKGFIRGEVCYCPFQEIIESSGKSLKEMARVALDPIGMYRKISSGELWCDNDNKKSNQPIVFYTGLSVHIPDVSDTNKHKMIFRVRMTG